MLDRPTGRRSAIRDPDLRVDVLHVVLRRPRRDEELSGDLTRGPAVGHEAEHLDLATAQAAGPRRAGPLVRVAARDIDLQEGVGRRCAKVKSGARRPELSGLRLAKLVGDPVADVAELGIRDEGSKVRATARRAV